MSNAIAPIDPDRAEADLLGLAETLPAGEVAPHRHGRAQLIYAVAGAITVTTTAGIWVLPPSRALWVPAGEWHGLRLRRPAELRTIYVAGEADGAPPWQRCIVVAVPPLLRELLLVAVTESAKGRLDEAGRRLARVLLDRLAALPELPVHLPEPHDERARRMAALLRADLDAPQPLAARTIEAGASRRTMERLFLTETGLSLGAWRQQLRLLHALDLLAGGAAVADVGFAIGYQNPSSFIAVFRRAFGTKPAQYFEA
jgi:AraC-like DNA-binding protein/mannose-6-phosphate isomerase-like protein (cupin superfamily)